jgi:hypothetical protein
MNIGVACDERDDDVVRPTGGAGVEGVQRDEEWQRPDL